MIIRSLFFLCFSLGLSALDQGLPYTQNVELDDKIWKVSEFKDDSPLVIRLVEIKEKGEKYIYNLEFFAREAGNYDLLEYLVNDQGERPDQKILLSFQTSLDDNFDGELKGFENSQIQLEPVYSSWLPYFGWFWLAGLLLIIFLGRKKKAHKESIESVEQSLSQYFLEKIEYLNNGKTDKEIWQEIEALFLRFCYERYGLENKDSMEALGEIRNRSESSELFLLLEHGLHSGGQSNTEQLINKLKSFAESAK